MPNPKCYLAGPFFNPEQILVISKLEDTLESYTELFSPRKAGGTIGKDAKMSMTEIFEINYKHIAGSDLMVAQIEALDDRPVQVAKRAIHDHLATYQPMIDVMNLRANDRDAVHALLRGFEETVNDHLETIMGKFLPNYSDIGTIWEMGVAYELGIPVIAFNPNKGRMMNVMLSESCRGFVNNYEDLPAAIETVVNGGTYGRHTGKVT